MRKTTKQLAVCMAAAMSVTAVSGMTAVASSDKAFSIDMTKGAEGVWEQIAMANDDTVTTGVNIRIAPDEKGEVIACLYRGGAVKVLHKGEEWTEVEAAGAIGYIKNEYLMYGADAKGLADYYGVEGVEASWNDVNVFASASPDANIIHSADDGDAFQVVNDEGHWIGVQVGADDMAYVSEEDVTRVLLVDEAVLMDGSNSGAQADTYQEPSYSQESAEPEYTEESYSDTTYSDSYSDDSYTDYSYTDESYTDSSYTDESYSDSSYTDNSYTDGSYTDNGYTDDSYTDDGYYTDESYTDSSTDSSYTDNSYTDSSTDSSYTDNSYTDSSTDSNYTDNSYTDSSTDGSYTDNSYTDESAADNSSTGGSSDGSQDSTASAGDLDLLAALIYCEAGNQSYEGMVAVGAVVMNRVASSSFPGTISEVIYQSGQFTPAYSGMLSSAMANGVPSACYDAASAAMAGENPVGSALYFNTGSGKGIKIGDHQFY